MIRQYIINSTALNVFVKLLNYFYYLSISVFLGYGVSVDSVSYIEGAVGFTVLLPLHFFNFILIPALKDKESFHERFSTVFYFSLIWGAGCSLIFFLYSSEFMHLFYPGLSSEYLDFINSSLYLISGYILFSLINNFMSISLDAAEKHTMVYKVLIFKALVSIIILLLFNSEKNILFLVLFTTTILEFFFLVAIFNKSIRFVFLFSFLFSLVRESRFVVLFVFVGLSFGVVDRYFISYLESGSMSILKYSNLIIGMISGLIPIGRVLYPYLSISNKEDQMKYFLKAYKIILIIYVPVLMFIFTFPMFIPDLLFGYGKVGLDEIKGIGQALILLTPTAVLGIMIGILDKLLFLQKLYKALLFRFIGVLLINGIGNYLSVFVYDWGLQGILSFTALSHLYIFISSYWLISKNRQVRS